MGSPGPWTGFARCRNVFKTYASLIPVMTRNVLRTLRAAYWRTPTAEYSKTLTSHDGGRITRADCCRSRAIPARMLVNGVINELTNSMDSSNLLSYFFCQDTDSRINNATAVLRGLMSLLVNQHSEVTRYFSLVKEETSEQNRVLAYVSSTMLFQGRRFRSSFSTHLLRFRINCGHGPYLQGIGMWSTW